MYVTVMTVPAHLVYMNIPAKELRTFVDGLFSSLAKNQIADATTGYWHRYEYGHDLLVDVPRTLFSHGPGESMRHFGHVVLTDFPTKAGIPIPGFSNSGFGPLLEQAGIHRGWLNVSLFDGSVGILCVAEGSTDLAQAIAGDLGMNWGTFFDTFVEGGIEIGFSMATQNPILLLAGIQNTLTGMVATWNELTTYVDPLDFFGAGGVSTIIGFVLAHRLMGGDLSEAGKDAIRSGTIGALFTMSSAFGFGALVGFASNRLGRGLANKHNEILSASFSLNENTYRLLVDEICKGNIPVRELLEDASPQLKYLEKATLLKTRGEPFTDNIESLSTHYATLRTVPQFLKSNKKYTPLSKNKGLPTDPPILTDLYRAAIPVYQ